MKHRVLIIALSAFIIILTFAFVYQREINIYIPQRAFEHKITGLEQYDDRIADKSMELIRNNPDKYAPILIKEVASSNPTRSDMAAYLLRQTNTNFNTQFMNIMKTSKYLHVRRNVIALIEPDSSAYEMISGIFRDPMEDDEIRYICGNLLARVENRDLVKQNITLLKDKDPRVRERAVRLFGLYSVDEYTKVIETMTGDPDEKVRFAVAVAILDTKGDFDPKNLKLIYKYSEVQTEKTLKHIAAKRDKKAVPYLKEFIKTVKDKYLKAQAEKTLRGLLNAQP